MFTRRRVRALLLAARLEASGPDGQGAGEKGLGCLRRAGKAMDGSSGGRNGYASKILTQGTAGFSPSVHLPGQAIVATNF